MDINRKSKDDEIEDILTEFPVDKPRHKAEPINKPKKPNNLKNLNPKAIFIIGIILGLLIGWIFSFCLKDTQEVCDDCKVCVQEISLEKIKQQIITQGYVEIKSGTTVLKLAPYTG